MEKALQWAAAFVALCSIVMLLWIGYGLQINSPHPTQMCPLHNATRQGHVHIVEQLLHEGVDVQQHDLLGRTTLHIAACEGTPTVLLRLLQQQAQATALDHYRRTPLHWAAKNPQAHEVIRLLLQAGIDVNTQDRFGMTALHLAAKHGNLPCVKQLIEAGAGTRIYDAFGNTPYAWALTNKHKKVAELLTK